MRNKALAAAALVAAGLAMAAISSRLQPAAAPAPAPPPPVLAPAAGEAAFTAQMLAPDALPAGLATVPLQAEGRVVWMQPGESLRHQWPGLTIRARFEGGSAYLLFDDAVNRFRVTIDGAAAGALTVTRPGRAVVALTGLTPGLHDILVQKLNESPAPAGFGGIRAPVAATPPAPVAAPIIEFIGDSDSVGYGNTASARDCSGDQVFLATDSTQAFPAQVAARLGARARVIARSGIGIVRNYEGAAPGETMLDLYPLDQPAMDALPALPEDPAELVVLALGSNDFSTPLAKDEGWTGPADLEADAAAGLADLAEAALRRNPGADLLLLAFGEYGAGLMEAHHQAMARLLATLPDARLVTLPELARDACHWHPSLADHARIAETLLTALAPEPAADRVHE